MEKKLEGNYIRKVLAIAKKEILEWILDSRHLVLVCSYIVIYEKIVKELLEMSEKINEPINILEPFIALSGNGYATVLLPVVFLILISDFPKIDGNMQFYIIRTGKVKWLLGQIIFAVFVSAGYTFVTFLVMCLIAAPHAYAGNVWSDVVTKYYLYFPNEKDGIENSLINGTLYNQKSPIQAFCHTFFLFFLLLFLLCMICLFGFVISKKIECIFLSGFLIVLGGITVYEDWKCKWYLPIVHTMVWQHYHPVLKKEIVSLWNSYLYFIVMIMILILLVFLGIKKKNFERVEEV